MIGDTVLALVILAVMALFFYGLDYDLRALLAAQEDEVGAGADRPGSGVEEPSVLGGTLTAAGADDLPEAVA